MRIRQAAYVLVCLGCVCVSDPAAAQGWSGVWCARGGQDALVLEQSGTQLRLELSSWQGGGHHCGVAMVLGAAGTSWQGSAGGCAVAVWAEGGEVVLGARGCEQQCGARATLDGLRFGPADRLAGVPAAGVTLSMEGRSPCG